MEKAIEKACTLARKAWGGQNVVHGVSQIMDAACGHGPNSDYIREEDIKEEDIKFGLDGTAPPAYGQGNEGESFRRLK